MAASLFITLSCSRWAQECPRNRVKCCWVRAQGLCIASKICMVREHYLSRAITGWRVERAHPSCQRLSGRETLPL